MDSTLEFSRVFFKQLRLKFIMEHPKELQVQIGRAANKTVAQVSLEVGMDICRKRNSEAIISKPLLAIIDGLNVYILMYDYYQLAI